MRIPSQVPASLDTPSSQPGRLGAPSTPRPGSAPAAGEAGNAVGGDRATWTASTRALTTQALAQPDVRPALVSQYRSQIAAGTYQVPSTSVADSMLADPMTGLESPGRG